MRAMALLLYADFTDSHCHLASRRVDLLRAADVAVDWRAVETLPHLPVTGGRDPHRHANLARQREEVTGLLAEGEQFSGGLPGFVANTRAAVSAYAEAYGAGVGDDVRRLLFALYWEDGVDIGNPSSLRSPLAAPILRGVGGRPAVPVRVRRERNAGPDHDRCVAAHTRMA